MKKLSHLERLLGALYVSEGWHILWREHCDLSFKTRALINYDRAMQKNTWKEVLGVNQPGLRPQ